MFTGLIGRAGYNYGDQTFQKCDYDTHENVELVELNKRMLTELGYAGDHEHEFSQEVVDELASKAENLDLTPYKEFVDRCNNNRPWIWKDPRLTWTIRIWSKLLSFDETAYIILTREDEQAWISSNLRRHIQSMKFTKDYNHGITSSLKKYLTEHQQQYLEFTFEDLLLRPEFTVEALNKFLECSLTMDDVKAIYRYPLYRKSKGFKDKLKALAIYLKNYSQRDNGMHKS
ncbi:MAG: sulfotransferase domain-containing protein [Candidatus Heimdallarchaeota archaeon]|nr:sulfotransferase domain-containing protein [Candidatus Heimdallarchaeota archaeon]